MANCERIYLKRIYTGTLVLSFILLIFLIFGIYSLSKSSQKTETLTIEFIPEPVVDSDYPVYRVFSSSFLQDHILINLLLESTGKQPFGANINLLILEVVFVDKDIIRIFLRDAGKKMWNNDDFNYTSKYSNNNYEFRLISYPFSFEIIRKIDGETIFNTANIGFYFSERYIEIGTSSREDRINIGLGS